MGKVKLLFDLDDTILDFHTAERAALSGAFDAFGIEYDAETLRRYSEINLSCWEQLELGTMTREEVKYTRFERLFGEKGIDASASEVQDEYETRLGRGHYFVPGAPELLERLYGKYEMYLVSNGMAAVQAGRLESAGISHYFKDIFISETIGADKPSKEYFERCFALIPGLEKSRTMIVGDSLTSDIRGGLNAGIRTCWYNPRGKEPRDDIRAEFSICSLLELPELLERIFE